MVSQPARRQRAAQGRRSCSNAAKLRRHLPRRSRATGSRRGRNSPSSSCHGAETSGMPQASASNTRIVGMPGSAVDIGPPRHVHRHAMAREQRRHVDVGDPAAVAQCRCARSAAQRRVGIAHAAHRAAQSQAPCRLDQEFAQLLRALAVAPVADPHQVRSARSARGCGRNSRVSAASCQVKTWRPQPRRR